MFQRTEVCSALLPPRPAFPPASRAGRGLGVYESVSAGAAAASRRRLGYPLAIRPRAPRTAGSEVQSQPWERNSGSTYQGIFGNIKSKGGKCLGVDYAVKSGISNPSMMECGDDYKEFGDFELYNAWQLIQH